MKTYGGSLCLLLACLVAMTTADDEINPKCISTCHVICPMFDLTCQGDRGATCEMIKSKCHHSCVEQCACTVECEKSCEKYDLVCEDFCAKKCVKEVVLQAVYYNSFWKKVLRIPRELKHVEDENWDDQVEHW